MTVHILFILFDKMKNDSNQGLQLAGMENRIVQGL